MVDSVGDFAGATDLEDRVEVALFPGSFPVPWGQCGATAEYLACYVAESGADRSAASFVLNELVENVVKFAHDRMVQLVAGTRDGELVLRASNRVPTASIPALRERLEALATGDAQELLFQRVEENAEDPTATGSGLGFLTMRADYAATLGFRFSPADTEGWSILESEARLPRSGA